MVVDPVAQGQDGGGERVSPVGQFVGLLLRYGCYGLARHYPVTLHRPQCLREYLRGDPADGLAQLSET